MLLGLLSLFVLPAGMSNGGERTTALAARSGPAPAILFEGGGSSDVYFVRPDGSGMRRLTHTKVSERHPSWSPDGRRLAFGLYPKPFENFVELWVMDRDGGNATLVTDMAYGDPWFDWAPDGTRLVFAGRDTGDSHTDLFVVSVADGAVERLGGTPADDYRPDWSPDGSAMVFSSGDDVYTMAADGSEVTLLSEEAGEARWSPDSQRIAFESWRFDDNEEYGPYTSELFVIDRDGSDERRLTRAPNAKNGYAEWSPDGTRLAYLRWFDDDMGGGDPDVFVVDVEGGDVTHVGTSKGNEGPPEWGPRGRYLVYPADDDLWRKALEGSKRRLLTRGPKPPVWEVVDVFAP